MKQYSKILISFILSCILISANCVTGISYYKLPYFHNINKRVDIDEYDNVKYRGVYYNIHIHGEDDYALAFYPYANGDTLKMPDKIEFKGKKYKVTDVDFDNTEDNSYKLPSNFTVPYKTIYLPKYTTFFSIGHRVKLPNLKKIYVGQKIDGLYCLSDMPKLKVIIDKKNPYIKMKNGAVYSKNGKILYNLINSKKTYKIAKGTKSIEFCKNNTVEKVILPSSIKKLDFGAFGQCFKLKTVKLNKELKIIGELAFYECKSLKKITIPENVNKIGDKAFKNCNLLNSIVLPENIKKIEYETFKNCISLKKISIPKNVKKIENKAFKNCKELSEVIIECEEKAPEITMLFGDRSSAFKNTKDGIQFIVKNQTVADQLKEQLQNNKSGVKNAKILIGKKVVYQNING